VDHVSSVFGPLDSGLIDTEFYYVSVADLDVRPEGDTPLFQSSKKGTIYDEVMASFEALPETSEQLNYDDYAIVSVSPALVPNPYLPTFRIFSYNISGLQSSSVGAVGEDEYLQKTKMGRAARWMHLPYRHGDHGNNSPQCRSASYRDSWKCKRLRSWRSDGLAPSRKNSLWSPLGYAQVRRRVFILEFGVDQVYQVLHARAG
jgi:endopolyphosphatase